MKTSRRVGMMFFVALMMIHIGISAQETPVESEVLNLNFAIPAQLETLPGVSPEMAQAIFANRPYQWFDDLLKVKGLTKEFIESIEEKIEVSKLNINSVKMKELEVLPGITPDIAQAIIEKRAQKSFELLLELVQFPGIGEEEVAALEKFLVTKPEENEEKSDKGWQPRPQNLP